MPAPYFWPYRETFACVLFVPQPQERGEYNYDHGGSGIATGQKGVGATGAYAQVHSSSAACHAN